MSNMHPLLWFIVLVLVLPAIDAQCGEECDFIDAANSALFDGLATLPKKGYWRRLVTFKPSAQVVLHGNTAEDGLIAVARYGNGSVCVVAQSRHLKNFGGSEPNSDISQFHTNLKTWFRNGTTGTWNIAKPTTSAELSDALTLNTNKTIVSSGGVWTTEAEEDAVAEWVHNGGTLALGYDRQEFYDSTSESMKHLNFYKTALLAGIAIEEVGATMQNPIPTAISNTSALVALNLFNVNSTLTWANVKDNARLNYILDAVQADNRFFPHEVCNHVLKVFEPFAIDMESNMIWPYAQAPDTSPKVAVTDTDFAMYNLYHTLSLCHLWKDKAPNIDIYPGDVANPPAPETASFTFQSRNATHFHGTGFYLVASQELTMTITNDATDDTWTSFELWCGINTDKLMYKRYELSRLPIVHIRMPLVDRDTTFKSPYGGYLYFKSSAGVGSNLSITLSGMIPTPYLDIVKDVNVNDVWASRCNTPGLSAHIIGEYVEFFLPVDGGVCQNMTGQEVKDVILQWDKIVHKIEELNGMEFNTPAVEATYQTFTSDIQTSIGALHSGKPIVAKVDYGYVDFNLFLLTGIWENHWGPYHELGHNYDQYWWVWGDVVEATCNVMSYFCMERMTTQDWYNMTKIQFAVNRNKLQTWLADPAYESEDYDDLNRFLVYSQTIRDFRWSCTRDVLKSYVDDLAQGNPIPAKDDTNAKINQWVLRWSLTVGYNLAPLYATFWKWPVDVTTLNAISYLPAYFPDDPITQMPGAANLTALVLNTWSNLTRTVDPASLNCTYFDIEEYV